MYVKSNIPVKFNKKGTLAKSETLTIAGEIDSFTYHKNGLNVQGSYYKMVPEREEEGAPLVKGDLLYTFGEGYSIAEAKGMEQFIQNLTAESDWDLTWLKVYTVFLPQMLQALIEANPELTINDLTIINENL